MIHLIKEGFGCSEKLLPIEETKNSYYGEVRMELGFGRELSSSNTG